MVKLKFQQFPELNPRTVTIIGSAKAWRTGTLGL